MNLIGAFPQVHQQMFCTGEVLGLRQRAEDGLDKWNFGSSISGDDSKTAQLRSKATRCWIEGRKSGPIGGIENRAPPVLPVAFISADPFIHNTPISNTKTARRRDLDKIPIVCALKGNGGQSKILRSLIITREMSPQADSNSINRFTRKCRFQSFLFRHHVK